MLHWEGFFLLQSPVLSPAFVGLQAELFVGDQSGAIHIWDLKNDQTEQYVCIVGLRACVCVLVMCVLYTVFPRR